MVERTCKGSFTVEAAVLVSAALFLVYGVIMLLLCFHDKNILTGAVYETAVVAGRKQTQEPPFGEEEINQLWKERISGKMILFRKAEVKIECQKEYVLISAQASRSGLQISAEAKAAVTDPEKKIRDIRKLKKAAEGN